MMDFVPVLPKGGHNAIFYTSNHPKMRKSILCACTAAGMLLFYKATAQQTTGSGNLHKTVTHKSDGGGIKENSGTNRYHNQRIAQEIFMAHPIDYMRLAKYIESGVSGTLKSIHNDYLKNNDPNLKGDLGDDFHYDIKQWTQDDLTAFAKGAITYDLFEGLVKINNAAVQTVPGGKPFKISKDHTTISGDFTQDALDAQKALKAIMSSSCNNWWDFGLMIASAADASQQKREYYHQAAEARKAGKKTGAVIDPKNFSSDIAATDTRVQNIDPKAAFAAAGGVMSPEQAIFDEKANAGLAKLKAEKGIAQAA
jgi:hypothetical protein